MFNNPIMERKRFMTRWIFLFSRDLWEDLKKKEKLVLSFDFYSRRGGKSEGTQNCVFLALLVISSWDQQFLSFQTPDWEYCRFFWAFLTNFLDFSAIILRLFFSCVCVLDFEFVLWLFESVLTFESVLSLIWGWFELVLS